MRDRNLTFLAECLVDNDQFPVVFRPQLTVRLQS